MTAILVLGPESSGTRLMTQILLAAGLYGDAGNDQRLDQGIPDGVESLVWRRSVPHGRMWPDIAGMIDLLRQRGYHVRAVVTSRDWFAMVESQQRAGHVADAETARGNLQRAYPHITRTLELTATPYVVVSYEHLVQRPQAVVRRLCQFLHVDMPSALPELYDGNAKYYEE